MGYTTEFTGQIKIDPPLNQDEINYLNKFATTRRMNRTKGEYYIDGSGFKGQGRDDDVIDNNCPCPNQPSLWCQWVPTNNGEYIEWDENEKFDESVKWMEYLIVHFIGRNPIAKTTLPFLTGHTLSGEITAQGEESTDMWLLIVENNHVSTKDGCIVYK